MSDGVISRFICFIQSREDAGRTAIQGVHRWSPTSRFRECGYCGNDAKGFRPRLPAMTVEKRLIHNPCVESMDLVIPAFDRLPQCSRHGREWDDRFLCSLQTTHIRDFLKDVAREFGALSREMLARFLEDTGSG